MIFSNIGTLSNQHKAAKHKTYELQRSNITYAIYNPKYSAISGVVYNQYLYKLTCLYANN